MDAIMGVEIERRLETSWLNEKDKVVNLTLEGVKEGRTVFPH